MTGASVAMLFTQVGGAMAHPGHGIEASGHLHAVETLAYALVLAGLMAVGSVVLKRLVSHRASACRDHEKQSDCIR
jgi:hypothetical protein